MKIAIMGAIVAATVLSALPASAEVVVRAGENGVAIGERHHDNWRHNDNWRHRDWRHHRAECRTIRSRTVTPSGRVIIRTRSTC